MKLCKLHYIFSLDRYGTVPSVADPHYFDENPDPTFTNLLRIYLRYVVLDGNIN
jgi:hypothetical protein